MSKPELWLDIPGYEGRYQASSLGRIRSLPNQRRKSILVLKQQPHCRTGYMFVNLTSHNGTRWFQKGHWVARLICLTFHGPCPEGYEACHGDGNKLNNASDNLRWDTPTANQKDRELHGTANIGSQNPRSVLDEDQVRKIKVELKTRHSREVAKDFGVSELAIKNIKNGYNWSYIHV